MNGFASDEYINCKRWIAGRIQEGCSWNEVKRLCVNPELVEEEFDRLQNDELIIPPDMGLSEWIKLVSEQEANHIPIVDMYGISLEGKTNTFSLPTGSGSSWNQYKNYLLGKKDGKPKMSEKAVSFVEKNCHWLLNHIKRDTRDIGPVKGLVMGSVQSGKTANMIGLVSMAADYDWNFFVILSGTIDNLRKQTRDRFNHDLKPSQGVTWKVLDYTSNPDYLIDINTSEKYMEDDLSLNTLSHSSWGFRYVTVCLKNARRLERLINWLHSNPARAARLRILIIDDEADQASVNTAKMSECLTEDDVVERTTINQYIINLANGLESNGSSSKSPFQALNYISFTATPYANVLNEAFENSLYPKDFICSLPESDEYFGAKVIFGNTSDEKYHGMNIVRTIPPAEMSQLKLLHKGNSFALPTEFKKSVCWFLCAAALLRLRGYKKPVSMLIHTTAIQRSHFEEYDILKNWLSRERFTGTIISDCKLIYTEEKVKFTFEDLKASYPEYGRMNEIDDFFPDFDIIKPEIDLLLSHIVNILMGEDKSAEYIENAVHLCVDNCKANREAEEGTYLRIVYPTHKQLMRMAKAPVFIIMGGNTLSRGLTLEGLTCTYFARNSNQADTLMQMARWFGYRRGYELLQRIWMPTSIQTKFELLEEIDEKLKIELQDFMDKGRSPAQFGPRIINSAQIAKFLITAKNKSQNAELCDFDFSGDSYETTKFRNDGKTLAENIYSTEEFLRSIGNACQSDISGSAFVWHKVDYNIVKQGFFEKYHIFDCSSLYVDIPIFLRWMEEMNKEGRYLMWNIAIVGDKNSEGRWVVDALDVGKIERSKKVDKPYIDIGSLRSGRDAVCDVVLDELSPEQRTAFDSTKKSGKNIISARSLFGLEDIPLLLLYRIDKSLGKESKARKKIGSNEDIIGFSIIISGDSIGESHAKTLRVRMPIDF